MIVYTVDKYINLYLEQWTHTHTHTHTWSSGHTHTHTHTHTWSSGHTHTWSSGHTHTHIYTTHTHTHTPGAVDTHTHTHTHLEQWASGEQLGVRCLAQGSHLSRGQFLPEPRFEPTTSGYKSNDISIRHETRMKILLRISRLLFYRKKV